MKRICFCLFLLFSLPLWGQDYVRKTYYGQGTTRERALQELLEAVGEAVDFRPPRLLESYKADISAVVVEQQQNGKRVLQLSGTALDGIFQARQNRAAGILEEGRRATDPTVRVLYYHWAWYYLSSLPAGHRLPGKEEVEAWLLAHPDVKPAVLPVPMTHIEREVAVLRGILGDIFPARSAVIPEKKMAATPPVRSVQEPLPEPLPERIPVATVPAEVPLLRPSFTPPAPTLQRPSPSPGTSAGKQETAWKVSVLATAGFSPEFHLGAAVSVRKQWGALAGFQSNFRPVSASYTAESKGNTVDGNNYIWPNGNTSVQQLRIYTGASRAVLPWLDLFMTAGYGYRKIYWQDTDQRWAWMKDISCSGPAIGAGALLGFGHLAALLEVSTISFQTLGISMGIGFTF